MTALKQKCDHNVIITLASAGEGLIYKAICTFTGVPGTSLSRKEMHTHDTKTTQYPIINGQFVKSAF